MQELVNDVKSSNFDKFKICFEMNSKWKNGEIMHDSPIVLRSIYTCLDGKLLREQEFMEALKDEHIVPLFNQWMILQAINIQRERFKKNESIRPFYLLTDINTVSNPFAIYDIVFYHFFY